MRKITKQDLVVLEYVYKNPGATTNAVYVNTSPTCVRTGRKKSTGTYGWTRPRTMVERGLVEIRVDRHLQEKAVTNLVAKYGSEKNATWYRWTTRCLVRYHWHVTPAGTAAVLGKQTHA